MDLKGFFDTIRQVEESILEPYAIVVSKKTSDGGKAGMLTEVAKGIAARLIAEGKAALASSEVAQEFRQKAAELKRMAEEMEAAGRLQVTVVSDSELKALKKGALPPKA